MVITKEFPTMRSIFVLLTLAFSSTACVTPQTASDAAPQSAVKSWGSPVTLTTVTPMGEAIKTFETIKDQDVLTTGKIIKVCEKKGCWFTLETDVQTVRVKFKDYAFFVPKDLAGQIARAQGRLVKETVSVRDQKHYLRDARAPSEQVRAVTEPKEEWIFIASGVEVGPKS
jgi:hypothetical protein